MKIFAALLIIMFLAFSGYHLTFRSFKLPLFARKFYLTGTEYLFFGLLLGPLFLDLLDTQTLQSLEPLSALLLGWIGLLCGFQFEISAFRRFPKTYLGAAITEAFTTFLIVSSSIYFITPLYFTFPDTFRVISAISLGAAAACTAQTGLALLTSKVTSKRSELILFLKYISSIDSIMAFLFFTPIFLFNTQTILKPSWFTPPGFEVFAILIVNLCLVTLYNLFLAQKRNKNELFLVIIGMVVLTSGAASTLQFSPLIANFVMGGFMVNTTREKERIFSLLVSIEKPVYLLLIVFIGAFWVPDSFAFILLAFLYCTVRLTGKITGGFLAAKLSYKKHRFTGNPGFGLIEQGGIPLAILFDFQQGFPGDLTTRIVSIAIIALIINDLFSPFFIQRLLNKEAS